MYAKLGIRNLLFAIFFISNLVSCNHSIPNFSKKEAQFASMFPEIRMGEHLRLAAFYNGPIPPETEEDYVNIAIINISNQQIIISPDLPHQNFIYDNAKDEWIPIPERLFSDGAAIILYPKTNLEKEQFSDWGGPVSPDLTGYNRPITVRILFLGEIAQNGETTGQKVGTYIDITFK
jgi:hypothetical protein